MSVKIKLCGMMRPEDIQTANALMPDYVGFIFAPGSRRAVSHGMAKVLSAALDLGITPVGVFVDAPLKEMISLVNKGIIRAIQLHGKEEESTIITLGKSVSVPIIKAFSMTKPGDGARARASSADLVLLDNGPGGTGAVFDWALIQEMDRPYLLAGGLTPDNVGMAIQGHAPWGVDASSGIETQGRKDSEKMQRFVKAVRRTEEREKP